MLCGREDESHEDSYIGDFPVACRVLPERFRWTIVRTGIEDKAFLDDSMDGTRRFPTGVARIFEADVAAFTSGEPDRAFLAREEPGPLGSRALSLAPNELLYEEFRRAHALGMTLPYGPGEADEEIARAYVRFALGLAEERTLAAQRRNLERALQAVNGTEFATAMPTVAVEEAAREFQKVSYLRRYRETDEVCAAFADVLGRHDRPLDVAKTLATCAEGQMADDVVAGDPLRDTPPVFTAAAVRAAGKLAQDLALRRGEGTLAAVRTARAVAETYRTPRNGRGADLDAAQAVAQARAATRENPPGPRLTPDVARLLAGQGSSR